METSQVFSKEQRQWQGQGQGQGQGQSCTAPKSGLVELGNWCNGKIVQISCNDSVETCTLRLPSLRLFGFSCLVVVVSAGRDVMLDLNGQVVETCLDGVGSVVLGLGGGGNGSGSGSGSGNGGLVEQGLLERLLVSPVVGTRLEFRCDGHSWFIYSDYSRSLPLAAVTTFNAGRYVVTFVSETLISPTPSPLNFVSISFTKKLTKGKIYKIVNGQNKWYSLTNKFDYNLFNVSAIMNANDDSIRTVNNLLAPYIGVESGIPNNKSAIGDSFLVVNIGSSYFLCGSSFGKITE